MTNRLRFLSFPLLLSGITACVDPYESNLHLALNVLVVDGTVTNLAEPQLIRLNRSLVISGLPGVLPVTKARVEVVVDSGEVVSAHETEDGTYQLPSDFKGQIGHAYQLRLTLSDGTQYASTQQVMPAVPPITAVRPQFNPNSLLASQFGGYTAAHDFYLNTQDPGGQTNYYRWDWRQWEKQDWCRTCIEGVYSINNVIANRYPNGLLYFTPGDSLLEDCYYPPPLPVHPGWFYDYLCRTQCWAIFNSHSINVFSDAYSNGGAITDRKVAQIPFYQHNPCLVEIRQAALTPSAYRFFKLLQDQTQNNGGVADTPPSASVGNVRNIANNREPVVGVFTASAVATLRYWLDRKDTEGVPPGLFAALNGREPQPEPSRPGVPIVEIMTNIPALRQPYTAICVPSTGQTPLKPLGWRD